MANNKLSIFKEIIRLTSQIISVRLLYIAAAVIGMILIAHLGKPELAAGALATTFSNTISVIGMSPLLAIGIIASRYYGEGKLKEIGELVRQAWVLSIILGVGAGLLLWLLADSLVYLDQPGELIPLVRAYLHGLAWGTVPLFLLASCYQLFFPIRKGNLVVLWGIMNLVGILGLGTMLTLGYVGFPRFGIGGWAYATSIVNWVILAWTMAYLYFHPDFKSYELFHFKEKINVSQLKFFIKMSLPITIQFSGELLAFSALNIMVGWLGVSALAVQQIVIQCSTLALMFPMGSAQTSAILIGQAIGRNEKEQVRPIFFLSLLFVVICMGIIAVLYLVMPTTISSIYINPDLAKNADIIQLATLVLAIAAVSQIADAIRNVSIGALRGLHDVWQPMWINIILLWLVALPGAYLLGFTFNYGVAGLNVGFLIAFTLGAILMTRRFIIYDRRTTEAPAEKLPSGVTA